MLCGVVFFFLPKAENKHVQMVQGSGVQADAFLAEQRVLFLLKQIFAYRIL